MEMDYHKRPMGKGSHGPNKDRQGLERASEMTPSTEREAHISSALGLRRTARSWLRMARDYPHDRERCVSEAKRLLNYAIWNISMARRADSWNEWRETQ